jgi:hypothetical protein
MDEWSILARLQDYENEKKKENEKYMQQMK